ncbi:MAG: hypothetical protein AB8C95_00175 [Phycisphaeraceae bacterium]
MSTSWVRYSVAVYLGLLISGALAKPPLQAPAAPPTVAPSVYHEVPTPGEALPAIPEADKRANS